MKEIYKNWIEYVKDTFDVKIRQKTVFFKRNLEITLSDDEIFIIRDRQVKKINNEKELISFTLRNGKLKIGNL